MLSPGTVKVLFVGKSAKGCSFLMEQLQKQGCDCRMATSSPEAVQFSLGRAFDLVLCTGQMEGISALIASFLGTPTTLFRCYPAEDSCWWLPVVWHGEGCINRPALRPGEFIVVLDRLVDEIKAGKTPLGAIHLTGGGCYDWALRHAPGVKQACESPVGGPRDDLL